jgi:hypothetical protein
MGLEDEEPDTLIKKKKTSKKQEKGLALRDKVNKVAEDMNDIASPNQKRKAGPDIGLAR